MREIVQDLKFFWSKKLFAIGLPLIMVLSYATLLFNPTVGIDDTAFKLYFVDGVAPATGRWVLYLMQKLIPLNYNPYFVETVGLLCFCLSVSLWCVLFHRILGERVSMPGYLLFAGVMISSPMLSEIVVWYLQNGIYLGYGMTALAVLVMTDAMRMENMAQKRYFAKSVCLCGFLLTVSLGFYESFMIVFLMGTVMAFLLLRLYQREAYGTNPAHWLLHAALSGGIALLLRSLAVRILTVLFHLEDQFFILENKNFSYILESVRGWFDGSRSPDELAMVLKEFFVKYYLHAIVYAPVMILVLAVVLLLLWGICMAVRHRDGWVFAGVAGIVLLPWLMPFLEGMATYYRASQYVPLLTAFAVLLAALEIRQLKVYKMCYILGLFTGGYCCTGRVMR